MSISHAIGAARVALSFHSRKREEKKRITINGTRAQVKYTTCQTEIQISPTGLHVHILSSHSRETSLKEWQPFSQVTRSTCT